MVVEPEIPGGVEWDGWVWRKLDDGIVGWDGCVWRMLEVMKSVIALGATPSFFATAFFALACGGDAELVKMMLRYVEQEGGRREGERRGKSFFLIFC